MDPQPVVAGPSPQHLPPVRRKRQASDEPYCSRIVFRWLKETSATGHLRNASAPNRRVQDGLKHPLLCLACERRFGSFEAAFATKLFYPVASGRTLPNDYGVNHRGVSVPIGTISH